MGYTTELPKKKKSRQFARDWVEITVLGFALLVLFLIPLFALYDFFKLMTRSLDL